MDLAEIRKKAKSVKRGADRTKGDSSPGAGRSSLSIQGAPVVKAPANREPAPVADSAPPVATSQVPNAIDAIDALFAWRPDLDLELATEENYHQGFSKEQQSVEVSRQLLTFALGNEEYALDLEHIREIIKPREVTDIPRVPEFILGIVSLRGVVIPVFDLRRRLRLEGAEASPSSRIVVCEEGDRLAGLLVDNISQVVHLPVSKIEPPPNLLSGIDRDMVEGVGRHQGRMMILLNLRSVMDVNLI
jgi:purine-binding chemotaxis protein CheW